MHLPHPRVLDGQGQRLARAVALERQDDEVVGLRRQQHRRAGLRLGDRVDHRHRGQRVPALDRGLLRLGNLRGGMARAGAGGGHAHLGEEALLRVGSQRIEHDGQHVGDRRARIPALGERPVAAQHQQPAAAPVDEVGDHPELIRREVVRLDAAEDQAAVPEEVGARRREAPGQLVRPLDAEAEELVLGRALQQRDVEVLVVRHPAQEKLHLPARLAFEVQDPLAAVLDDDQRLAEIVLGDHLARLRRHPEAEEPGPRLGGGEAHPHRLRLAVGGQLHVLRGDDAALVLYLHGHRLAAVAAVRDHQLDRQRRAAQHAARRSHTAQLDVALELLAAQPHREDRHALRLQREQRLAQAAFQVVGAVAHHDQTGQRHARQLVVRPLERPPEVRPRAAERQLVQRRHAIGLPREPEEPQGEPVGEGGPQLAVGRAELPAHELVARRLVAIGDLHAARVVDEDAEEVLLRHHRRQHEHRPEQAERQHAQRGDADDGQDGAVRRLAVPAHREIRAQREVGRAGGGAERKQADPGRPERELALLEDQRAVLEQELEEWLEHDPSAVPVATVNGSSRRR